MSASLHESLRSALAGTSAGTDAGVGRLAAALAPRLDEARAAHPRIDAPREGFARWVAERLPDDEDPRAVEQLHVADLYVAFACALGLPAALDVFERDVMSGVAPAVSRVDRDPAFAADVAQDLRVALLVSESGAPAKIAGYLGRGPLRSWVQVAAIRAAYSLKRKDASAPPRADEALADLLLVEDDPEVAGARDQVLPAFRDALGAALTALPRRERNVLRMHFVEGLPSETIARMYGVHRATVARWIGDARTAVLAAVRASLESKLHVAPTTFASLVRLVQGQLDFSVAGLLSERGDTHPPANR